MASDSKGRPVNVGTKVRVVQLPDYLKENLPPDEWRDLKTMVGEVFEVYEIDEYGAPWVEKCWHDSDGQIRSHSLALDAHEMEVVEDSRE